MDMQALRHEDEEMYQFACPNRWAVETVTLTLAPSANVRMWLASWSSERRRARRRRCLDHPHSEPHCSSRGALHAHAAGSGARSTFEKP
jgi:hypothetical protein